MTVFVVGPSVPQSVPLHEATYSVHILSTTSISSKPMVTMAMFTLLSLVVIDCVSPALSVATTSTFEISGSSGSCSSHFRHVFLCAFFTLHHSIRQILTISAAIFRCGKNTTVDISSCAAAFGDSTSCFLVIEDEN